jgi:hypothetical protein
MEIDSNPEVRPLLDSIKFYIWTMTLQLYMMLYCTDNALLH